MNLDDIGYLKDFPPFVKDGTPLCAETDPELFFPSETFEGALKIKEVYSNEMEAKKICGQCPYQLACFSYAIKAVDLHGIWGGTTAKDRASIRRGRGARVQRSLGLTPTKRR